ncbi:MAG TPA: hypothetical protein VFH73_23800 [Polyangia bacterium]|jgi:hypothetical protein|nr:hypothetical protein [Polyangia bacterium]
MADGFYPRTPAPRDWTNVLFFAGIASWIVAMLITWPLSLSFGDEIGYVGQAKLFLEGRLHVAANTPGVWVRTPNGLVAQYTLMVPLLITPLLALLPRAVFISGAAAAVGLAWIGGRALRSWGRNPLWALIILAHPTIVIISRTVMSDLLLAFFAVAAWWSLRNDRRIVTVLSFVALTATKPIGFLLGLALVVGEGATMWRALQIRQPAALSRMRLGVVAFAAGLAATVASNLVSTGKLWFGYNLAFLGTPPFWFRYLTVSGPVHLLSVLLNPPLLIAGVWTFWRQRDFGPLLVIFGMGTMMSFYYFVDFGTNWFESLVLSPRLILPVIAFLMIGYTNALAALWERLGRRQRSAVPVLLLLPALIALGIGTRHRKWQEPMAKALAAASVIARRVGAPELWLTDNACKAGLLYDGPTRLLDATSNPAVILCSTRPASYRQPMGTYTCDLPGYRSEAAADGFEVLVRK